MPDAEYLTLKSEQDGLELALMLVRPEGEIRGLVQLAHGMSEHKERYLPFMRWLAGQGCLCVINDHRGHGASVRSRDDLGYFYQNGDHALVEDLHQISLWMKAQWQDVPLVLFGHSMGSLAVRAYCKDYDGEIDGLVVCGSPGANPAAIPGLVLVELMRLFRGERYRSELMRSMSVGAFAKRFPDPQHPCAWLSVNMENVIAYEADPLCGFNFTLNGNRALLQLMRRAYGLDDGRQDLPVYFVSGADDPCAPDAKGFEDAMENMRSAGYARVQGRMIPGMRHEILNETGREAVFETIWREGIAPCLH